jgi:phosphatidylserine/phosphatidylglycerophosphate/cardiolipin synthase-like enzyme
MPSDPFAALGEFLTANEARGLAVQLAAGQHVAVALHEVNSSRRDQAKALLLAAGLGHEDVDRSVGVLRSIAGAKSVDRDITPVWTMPGNEATVGYLTGEFHKLVLGARSAVTCATYNFEPTSQMWTTLRTASEQPGVAVAVYVDGDKADALKVQAQLPRATVYRSAVLSDGKRMVSHAKFVIVDHVIVLLTSANFSFSAENRNVEFGLRIHDPALAASIEATMASKHGSLYELA